MKLANRGNVISFGVDWLTVTANQESKVEMMLKTASALLTWRMQTGFERKGWGMAGFSGWRSSGVKYGVRDNEAIVVLSSAMAQTHWRQFYEVADNCSRIDYQLTHFDGACASDRVRRHYAEARRHSRGQKKPPSVTYIRSTPGGDTLYLGSRQSNVFGRVYDKGLESKDKTLLNCVRYEVELKGRLAWSMSTRSYFERNDWDGAVPRLSRFMRSRGISFPVNPAAKSYETSRPVTDDDSRLRWLRDSVRPSVQHLVACRKLELVLHCLGLYDLVHTDQLVQGIVDQVEKGD